MKNLNLTKEQQNAINSAENKCNLIIATPGSGKTTVFVEKIVDLIVNKGYFPSEIIAVTYTNFYATQVKQALVESLKKHRKNYTMCDFEYLGTFHHVFLRIMKSFDQEKLQKLFFIPITNLYGEKQLADYFDMKYTDEDNEVDNFIKVMQRIKKFCYSLYPKSFCEGYYTNEEFNDLHKRINPNKSFFNEYGDARKINRFKAFLSYQKFLKRENFYDSIDIYSYFDFFLKTYPEEIEKLQKKFKCILIDELQDTNQIPFIWIKNMSSKTDFFCVGDPNQAIFQFAGIVDKIFSLMQEHIQNSGREYEIYPLSTNFRSSKNIISFGNEILKNIFELEGSKNIIEIKANNSAEIGEKVTYHKFQNKESLNKHIVDKLLTKWKNNGVKNRDICLLFRRWSDVEELMALLEMKEIPHLNRRKSKDIHRVDKITNLIFAIIFSSCAKHQSLNQLLEILVKEADLKIDIKEFIGKVDFNYDNHCSAYSLNELLDDPIFEKIVPSPEKIEIIKTEIIYFYKKHKFNKIKEDLTLRDFFVEVLPHIIDFYKLKQEEDYINVLTIHTSKGGEWDHVVIVDFVDQPQDFPPRQGERQKKEKIIETNKLFFVAATRARKELFIGWYDNLCRSESCVMEKIKDSCQEQGHLIVIED